MQTRTKYYIADQMQHFCAHLGIPPQNILRRANLPEDYFDKDDPGLSPHQMFAIWDASAQELRRPDLPVLMGTEMARGHSGSVILSFTCSHTVAAGFDRIAVFKPLVGPILLEIKRSETEYTVSIRSTIPTLPLPDVLAAMDIVFFVELVRYTTGEDITPFRATLPKLSHSTGAVETHIGIPVVASETVSVTFDASVADLPLVTQNEALWSFYEKDLQRQLDAHERNTPTTDRLRATLQKMLPSGRHTADDACQRLGLSKRTLQRQLTAEGTTYQTVLDTTRSELSLHYLRKHNLTVDEISYLLAYRDPNSFYRAFQGWTGMTPAQARG
jgi:AraC-like DNA-binding protein